MTVLGFQQRLFPSLRVGRTATVTRGRRHGIRLHCRQGAWDGACGLHCAAMALTLLGRLSGCDRLPARGRGLAAALWRSGIDTYFEGADAGELADLLCGIDAGLFVRHRTGSHRQLLRLAQAQLEAGRLAIIAWRSRNRRIDHWVLAVGLEGVQAGAAFRHTALLCLDPSSPQPSLCGYNSRLELTGNPASYGGTYLRFLTNQGDTLPVTLTGIVVVGDATGKGTE